MLVDEEQTVNFDPRYICYQPVPWYTRLFTLYLFAVIVLMIFRTVSLASGLWRMRASKSAATAPAAILERCESAFARIKTLKNISLLTLFLSVANFALCLAGSLQQVAIQKTAGLVALSGAIAECLSTFAFEFFICSVLFALAIFFEHLFARRRQRLPRPGETAGTNPDSNI